MAKINDNICTFRKANQMSLEELGKKIGTSRQTIQRYESGEIKNIPYDKINALADALGVTPIQLMGLDDNTETTPTPKYVPEIQIFADYLPKLTQKQIDQLVQLLKLFAEQNQDQ